MGENLKNREIWLKDALLKISPGLRILDAGAGELQYKKFCEHLNYVSQDFAKYNGEGNSKGLQTEKWEQAGLDIISDITSIPEPDESFDAIMCVEVFEHLPDPVLALKEFWRLLKPDGTLIITVPFCSLTHFAPYHYYSGFNTYFFDHHLKKEGFRIVEMSKNGNYFSYMIQELSRLNMVADTYSSESDKNILKRLLNKFALKVIFSRLKNLNMYNNGSEELLCFGINIQAKKQDDEE